MQQNSTNFLKKTQKYSTRDACPKALNRSRWENGFICPKFGHAKSCQLKHRHLHKCEYSHQISPMYWTVFEHACLPLPKWFAAINLIVADNNGILAERLSKIIDAPWPTAYQTLRILRQSLGDRGHLLDGFVEMYDAFVGVHKSGRRGLSTEGKKTVIFPVVYQIKHMDFMAAHLIERVNFGQISKLTWRFLPESEARKGAFLALLWILYTLHRHQGKSILPEKTDELFLKVHSVISNFKNFPAGTFHSVSHRYLPEYIVKLVFRFNYLFREYLLPDHLLQTVFYCLLIRAFAIYSGMICLFRLAN